MAQATRVAIRIKLFKAFMVLSLWSSLRGRIANLSADLRLPCCSGCLDRDYFALSDNRPAGNDTRYDRTVRRIWPKIRGTRAAVCTQVGHGAIRIEISRHQRSCV